MTSVFKDCFNMLVGEKLGSGIHREVFACKIRKDLVVKVENSDYRFFANVMEMQLWCENADSKEISKWLAPCEFMSPDGRILLQKRVLPILDRAKLPKQLPAFLSDLKMSNFGVLDGRIVCVDYAMTINSISSRMKKADWS